MYCNYRMVPIFDYYFTHYPSTRWKFNQKSLIRKLSWVHNIMLGSQWQRNSSESDIFIKNWVSYRWKSYVKQLSTFSICKILKHFGISKNLIVKLSLTIFSFKIDVLVLSIYLLFCGRNFCSLKLSPPYSSPTNYPKFLCQSFLF